MRPANPTMTSDCLRERTRSQHSWVLGGLLFWILAGIDCSAQLEIPAFTAYFDPDPDSAHVSSRTGITGWADPKETVSWYGELHTAVELDCSVALRLPADAISRLSLTLDGQTHESTVTGRGTNRVIAPFGRYPIRGPGYRHFLLRSLNAPGATGGDLEALLLGGPPTNGIHFNLKPRRNAASVHLSYPVGKGTNVASFYCELTAVEDPVYTYYMACGWHRGYFGMQVNSAHERRIIFSVWDSGKEAVERSKVNREDRVTLLAKGQGVTLGDFGNEGTGGHSHLTYPWRTGERQRFLVTAKPSDAEHTVYSGFYFHPDKKEWTLVSSWKAPKEGGWMRGLYSFSENFGGSNGHLLRKVRAGNQWIETDAGSWIEITSATFSHDGTGKVHRLDRFMGLEQGQFFLSHGGFIAGFTQYGDRFDRPSQGKPPRDLRLPDLPAF